MYQFQVMAILHEFPMSMPDMLAADEEAEAAAAVIDMLGLMVIEDMSILVEPGRDLKDSGRKVLLLDRRLVTSARFVREIYDDQAPTGFDETSYPSRIVLAVPHAISPTFPRRGKALTMATRNRLKAVPRAH